VRVPGRRLGGALATRDLADRFVRLYDREASLRIARWAYGQVARAGGQVWVEKDVLVRLGGEWEGVLTPVS
jgi:hypothetical protein